MAEVTLGDWQEIPSDLPEHLELGFGRALQGVTPYV